MLVNEVPTYRADQMPYGGLRDSGNTREGPHYAVHEMTESRLVILSEQRTSTSRIYPAGVSDRVQVQRARRKSGTRR